MCAQSLSLSLSQASCGVATTVMLLGCFCRRDTALAALAAKDSEILSAIEAYVDASSAPSVRATIVAI